MTKVAEYRSPQTQEAPPAPRPWNTHGVVAIAVVVLSLTGALAYAGPSAMDAVLLLLTDGLLLLAWLGSGAGAGAMLLLPLVGRRKGGHAAPATAGPSVGALVWFATAAALGLGVFGLLSLGLGLAGWLNRATTIGMLCAGAVGGIIFLSPRMTRPEGERRPAHWVESVRAWWHAPASWSWAWLAAVPFLSIALVGAMVTPGLLWKPYEPHGYDVVAYHLQIPREWYEAGRIVPLEHNVFSYFPLGVEVHYLLAMHLTGGPWAGMYLAQLMHLSLVVLSVAAACGFASRFAAPGTNTTLAGVAATAVPWLAQLAAIAYNEGGFLLYSTLSIGWALWAIRPRERRTRHFLLAGAMAGLACGTKLTAVPEVLLAVPLVSVVVMLVIRFTGFRELDDSPDDALRASPLTRRDWLGPALFALAGLLLFAPWLVRNQVWAGNPVFPEATGVFGNAHFSDVQVERWKRAHAPQPNLQSPAARLGEGWRQIVMSWQWGYALLPLALASLVVAWRNPAIWFVAGLLLLLALVWLAFTHLQSRFFILAVPLCILAIAQVRWGRWLPLALAVVILSAAPGWLHLHRYMATTLYAGEANERLVNALASRDVTWLTGIQTEGMIPDTPLVLVGDAKAFWYRTPAPVGRVYYRSTFDVDTSGGRGLLEAYTEGVPPEDRQWLLLDPGELERFARTYQPFPPPPPEWTGRTEWGRGIPFLIKVSPAPPSAPP